MNNLTSIFIFRRDLRLYDNKGLIYAMETHKNVIPIFILTPEQITNNKYRSDNSVAFMIESLIELNNELSTYNSKLYIFYGDNLKVLKKIITGLRNTKSEVSSVIFNMDYTPYAIKRDKSIQQLCKKNNINCIMTEDYLLSNIGFFNKSDGEPYLILTPFKNNALKQNGNNIDKPNKSKPKNLQTSRSQLDIGGVIKPNQLFDVCYVPRETTQRLSGGRSNALKQLNKIKNQKNYNKTRNSPTINTTLLSAYIKFGNISIREVFWKIKNTLGMKNELITQLLWREFYYYIAFYFPEVLKGHNFNSKFDGIKWTNNKKLFNSWCNGETGYPIVDAGMKQLNETGFMHNRLRLITSNFLNRILGIDWRWGERYYATKLTDYDPAVNNGNWQWIASTGVDTKPHSQRIFNPWTQSQKYDPDCSYIKKWLTNLQNIPNKHLHQWDKYNEEYDLDDIQYFEPIVDYKEGRNKSLKMYSLRAK